MSNEKILKLMRLRSDRPDVPGDVTTDTTGTWTGVGTIICSVCRGTGVISSKPCQNCKGTGVLK